MIGCPILRALCEGWDTTALHPEALHPHISAYPTLRKVREGWGTRSSVIARGFSRNANEFSPMRAVRGTRGSLVTCP